MTAHTYYHHLSDSGSIAPLVVDRDDGTHLLADAPEVVAWIKAGNTLLPATGPRVVQGAALVHALSKATKVCPRDLAYVAGLATAREDMASIGRIAAVDGSTAKAWFDAALGVTG